MVIRCTREQVAPHCPCACHLVERRPGLVLAGQHPGFTCADEFAGKLYHDARAVDRYREHGQPPESDAPLFEVVAEFRVSCEQFRTACESARSDLPSTDRPADL
jgi:hypothetical protein